MVRRIGVVTVVTVVAAIGAGCGNGDDHADRCSVEDRADPNYSPDLTPSNFVTGVDNPLLPWSLGWTWTYQNGAETIVVATQSTASVTVAGLTVVEVRDVASEGGSVIEDTLDWYAQDAMGNVWYMGEDTAEYENGEVVSTAGSWEAGVEGAQPGIVMPANPVLGVPYRQEFDPCNAEDIGVVVSFDETVTVPYGTFTGCWMTHDYTPLEPGADESKYYCAGVGNVLSVDNNTGEREELVTLTTSGALVFAAQ